MEASINERHLKDFVRLLQCASKFGEELAISANKDQWELAVTNSSKSAFCLFKLQPRFFSRYRVSGTPSEQRKGVKCQLLVKSVLAVLGKASAASSIERLDLKIHDPEGGLRTRKRSTSTQAGTNGTADTSDIGARDEDDYHEEVTTRGSMLIIRLVCKHGVTKKHSLHLGSTDFLRAEVDPNSTPSSFTISARTLRNWLDHFSLTSSSVNSSANPLKSENQLGWMFGKHEVRLKSWEGANKDLCTEIKLDVAEFGTDGDGSSRYWVEQERVDLTLPMKEFRATLQLADSLDIDLTVAFSESTQPLTMVYTGGEDDDFDIFCAIATTTCDAFPMDIGRNANGAGSNGDREVKPRRTISDLTDDAAGPVNQGSASKRQRSETPSRRRSQLDLTPTGKLHSSRPAVIFNSGEGPTGGNGDRPGGQEPLFLQGGSQEMDHDNDEDPVPALGSQRVQMSQEELMALTGLGDMDDLMSNLDEAEDEEFSSTQKQNGVEGQVRGADEWDDEDLNSRGPGQEFDIENSVLDFNPPMSQHASQNPTERGKAKSPTKAPQPTTPRRSSGSTPKAAVGSAGSGRGSKTSSLKAIVRTETAEQRYMNDPVDIPPEEGDSDGDFEAGATQHPSANESFVSLFND